VITSPEPRRGCALLLGGVERLSSALFMSRFTQVEALNTTSFDVGPI
jgi:hypothetical protein